MEKAEKIDADSLYETANNSEEKEALTILARMRNCRVGVGARVHSPTKTTFFIEIVAHLCAGHQSVNLNSMENSLLILRELNERGYVLKCEDGFVSCELPVPSEKLNEEYDAAIFIIKKTQRG
jgi:hypothetical protein